LPRALGHRIPFLENHLNTLGGNQKRRKRGRGKVTGLRSNRNAIDMSKNT